MTDARNAQIVALHHAGHSLRAIGREVKLSHEGVRLVLIGAGLTPKPVPRFDVRKAWRLYRTRSMVQVAEAFGVSPTEVCVAFQRHGLQARPPGRPTKAFQRRARVTPAARAGEVNERADERSFTG